MFFIIISALHVPDRPSAHHQEPIKLCSPGYCHAFLLSTAGVDRFQLLVWMGSNLSTPAVDSRKA